MEIRPGEFDRLFDSAVAAPDGTGGRAGRVPHAADEVESRLRAAVALFHRGEYGRCLSVLDRFGGDQAGDPRVSAFRASALALLHGDPRPGIQACVEALRRAFYLPDIYAALGVLLLRVGDRSKAHAAFRRGLKIDPRHGVLRARIQQMGVRRRPVVPFLPRSHPANRVLGFVRARLVTA